MRESNPAYKLLVKKGRNDPTVMDICHHEYLGDYGKLPPDNWEPSDKEVFAVVERIGIDQFLA